MVFKGYKGDTSSHLIGMGSYSHLGAIMVFQGICLKKGDTPIYIGPGMGSFGLF